MPQQAATIESLPQAFEGVKEMQADGPERGEGYRPLGRQAPAGIIDRDDPVLEPGIPSGRGRLKGWRADPSCQAKRRPRSSRTMTQARSASEGHGPAPAFRPATSATVTVPVKIT